MVETRSGAVTEGRGHTDIRTSTGPTTRARRGKWWAGGFDDSQLYTLLALGHLALALPLMFSGKQSAKAIFGKSADPVEDQHVHLLGLYASGLLSSAASAFALEECARHNMLHTWTADVLKLGLMAHFIMNILLMMYYPATLTFTAVVVEWLAAAATFILPASEALATDRDRKRIWHDLRRLPRDAPRFLSLRRYNFNTVMYSLLTIVFPLTGLAYFMAPDFTLFHTFGYDYGKSTQMIWKAIGGGALMSFLPAMTMVLKSKAESHTLTDTLSRSLNLGLMGTAVGHLLVFGPIAAKAHGGFLLPMILGTWAMTLLTAMVGLSSPELTHAIEHVAEAAKEQYKEQMGGIEQQAQMPSSPPLTHEQAAVAAAGGAGSSGGATAGAAPHRGTGTAY